MIAQSPSTNGTAPVIVRITDVQSDRFTMYLQEPPDENGTHTAEQVTYIVIEAGQWQLADGTLIEAGTVTTGRRGRAQHHRQLGVGRAFQRPSPTSRWS